MPLCTKCSRWYEVTPASNGCPICSLDATDRGSAPAAVARFRNWAEAGFFEDLLLSNGVAAQLQPREQFNAVDGSGEHVVLLYVKAEDFDRAHLLIGQQLEDAEQEELAGARPEISAGESPMSLADDAYGPPLWKPLAVVLVAGGLAYLGTHAIHWAGRAPAAAPVQPQRMEPDILRYLRSSEGVWEQRRDAQTPPRARMWHDRASGAIHVQEDRDGDGTFERRFEFHGAASRGGRPEKAF